MLRPFATAILLCVAAHAAVTRVEILERGDLPAFPGYQRIVGKIHFAVDPKLPANRIIADIDLAPRNAQGLVEFTADLFLLKPTDPAKGNGTVLFEVSNRGGKGMLSMFDLGGRPDPKTAEELGDPLLFDQGYTLAWVGWEWDVPEKPGMMRLDAPIIAGLTGLVRSEIVHSQRTNRGIAGRSRADSLRGGRPEIGDPHRARPPRRATHRHRTRSVELHQRRHGDRVRNRLRARTHLRSDLPGQGPRGRGPGSGGHPRLHFLPEATRAT